MAGVVLQRGFNVQSGPIDDRFVVENASARYALNVNIIYEGLVVYQKNTDQLFVLKNTANVNNTNGWIEITNQTPSETGVGFPFTGSAVISGSLQVSSLALPTSTLQSFTPTGTYPRNFPTDSNFKIVHLSSGNEFNISNPPSEGLNTDSNTNNISDIFNDPSKITKLFGNCLLLIDLGESKFLDKLLLSFNSTGIPQNISLFGSNDPNDLLNESTLPSTPLTVGALLGSNNPAEDYLITSNTVPTDFSTTPGENRILTVKVPSVNVNSFRYYALKFDGVYTIDAFGDINPGTSNLYRDIEIKDIDIYAKKQ